LNDVEATPSFQDLKSALRELETAQQALVKSAVVDDAAATRSASAEFRRSLGSVQTALSAIHQRYGRAEAERLLGDLRLLRRYERLLPGIAENDAPRWSRLTGGLFVSDGLESSL
jgi:hypothetical protein